MPRLSFLLFFLRVPVIVFIAHAYVAARLVPITQDPATETVTVIVLLLMYIAIMAGFVVREAVGRPMGDTLSWIGFFALGWFSWIFVLTVLRDLLLILLYPAQWVFALEAPPMIATLSLQTGRLVWLLSAAASLVGLINARRIPAVVHVDIDIPGLPAELDGFRLAQISDLHVGPTIKTGFVRSVVQRTNNLNADTIVLTGDLVDGGVPALRDHTRWLAGLQAAHGVFAVTGNHEYYAGAQAWIDEFRRLGLQVLLNEHVVLEYRGRSLVLAGVTDYDAQRFDPTQASDPQAALHGAPENAAIRILLAHQPRSAAHAAQAGFDLQISGHTHGGQFWPWGYFVPLQQPFVAGLHSQQGMQVYVSRGTGYWGPPLRFGARSEITLIKLRSAPAAR